MGISKSFAFPQGFMPFKVTMRQASLEELGLACQGDRALLDAPRRGLLVSRTPRRPTPATPWVRAVVEATQASAEKNEVLVCGVERAPFELALVTMRKARGAAVVVLEEAPDETWNTEYEALLPKRRLIIWPHSAIERSRRDALLGELSDRAWRIFVRKGGNMAATAKALSARGCTIDPDFEISSVQRKRQLRYSFNPSPPSSEMPDWDFLTHFTREADGAWPGESRAEYARWLAFGPLEARREARDGLHRILSQHRIWGSGRLMPDRATMVSFTARPPWDVGRLVKWRRGLGHWTFRPYGLSVARAMLEKVGARPVRYLDSKSLLRLSVAERAFGQKHQPPQTDWSEEAEWRLHGNFDFASVPREALRIVAPTPEEASKLAREFGLEAVSLSQ